MRLRLRFCVKHFVRYFQTLLEAIEEQRRAAEEQASRDILRSLLRAFREALLALPSEEYDWFQIADKKRNELTPTPRKV